MAHKTIKREVTRTVVKGALTKVVDGEFGLEPIEDVTLLGNVSQEMAERQLKQMHGSRAVVMELHPNTQKYELPLEFFLEHATPVEQKEQLELDSE